MDSKRIYGLPLMAAMIFLVVLGLLTFQWVASSVKTNLIDVYADTQEINSTVIYADRDREEIYVSYEIEQKMFVSTLYYFDFPDSETGDVIPVKVWLGEKSEAYTESFFAHNAVGEFLIGSALYFAISLAMIIGGTVVFFRTDKKRRKYLAVSFGRILNVPVIFNGEAKRPFRKRTYYRLVAEYTDDEGGKHRFKSPYCITLNSNIKSVRVYVYKNSYHIYYVDTDVYRVSV